MAKRLTYKQIQEITSSQINSWDEKQSREMLYAFRKKFESRQKTFNSAKNKNVFSPALDKMEKFYKTQLVDDPEKMSYRSLQRELQRIKEFFDAKTSDVSGARKVARDQDARLFGVFPSGRPMVRMTKEQRKAFWDAYDEFLAQNPKYNAGYMKVQQTLAEMVVNGSLTESGAMKNSKGNVIFGRIGELLEIHKRLESSEYTGDFGGYELQRY